MRPCVRCLRMSANLIAARPHALSRLITRDSLNSGLYSAAPAAPSTPKVRLKVTTIVSTSRRMGTSVGMASGSLADLNYCWSGLRAGRIGRAPLLDDLVCPDQHRRRNRQPKPLGRAHIDD